MDKLSKEDYYKLIQQLVEQQYDQEEDQLEEDFTMWTRSSYAKDRMVKSKEVLQSGIEKDMTSFKSDQIYKSLESCGSIKVGHFITKLHRVSQLVTDPTPKWNVKIWEKRFRTPSGSPCNMDFPLHMGRDKRFDNFKWKNQFNNNGGANSLTAGVIVDTIRWLQVIHKLPAFL